MSFHQIYALRVMKFVSKTLEYSFITSVYELHISLKFIETPIQSVENHSIIKVSSILVTLISHCDSHFEHSTISFTQIKQNDLILILTL